MAERFNGAICSAGMVSSSAVSVSWGTPSARSNCAEAMKMLRSCPVAVSGVVGEGRVLWIFCNRLSIVDSGLAGARGFNVCGGWASAGITGTLCLGRVCAWLDCGWVSESEFVLLSQARAIMAVIKIAMYIFRDFVMSILFRGEYIQVHSYITRVGV